MRERKGVKNNFSKLKIGYIRLFEDSFLNNYENWNSIMSNINDVVECLEPKAKKYVYDEFCILSKTIVESVVEEPDWINRICCVEVDVNESVLLDKQKYNDIYDNLRNGLIVSDQEILRRIMMFSINKALGDEAFIKNRGTILELMVQK